MIFSKAVVFGILAAAVAPLVHGFTPIQQTQLSRPSLLVRSTATEDKVEVRRSCFPFIRILCPSRLSRLMSLVRTLFV
jgi:hypothetical protein